MYRKRINKNDLVRNREEDRYIIMQRKLPDYILAIFEKAGKPLSIAELRRRLSLRGLKFQFEELYLIMAECSIFKLVKGRPANGFSKLVYRLKADSELTGAI